MSAFPSPPVLTEDGDFDMPTIPGVEYIFALKSEFDGATVTLTTRSGTDPEVFDSVEGGIFTDEAEQLFLAPSTSLRFTVSDAGASTAIRTTFLRREY